MDTIDRRRYKRYSIYCPIEYKSEDETPIESSITFNLCEGGALISAHRPLKPQSRLIIKISLGGEAFFLRARVVHFNCEKDGALYAVGVEFCENPFSFIRRFYEELETIMLYQRQFCKEAGRTLSLSEASIKWYSSARTRLARWMREGRAAFNG